MTKTKSKTKSKIITPKTHEKALRSKSEKVELNEIHTSKFQDFLDELYDEMINAPMKPGWMPGGISAIQINIPKQVFYCYNSNTDTYSEFINPKLELLGTKTDIRDEACLSLPDQLGPVSRSKRVKVTYLDRYGNKHSKEYSGWNARVLQHEYDHLQGILFIDKLEK